MANEFNLQFQVSDVVQNVQNVLKGELNKPVPIHASVTSIPGSVNSQWTNMLPYILSGGSVDQQDIAQDASILSPESDADQSYVDVVPLHSTKLDHYDPETNYVQVQPDEEIKVVTIKTTSNKPISLFGNMALDSGIFDEQEAHTMPPKSTNKPTTVTTYKFTTTKSPSIKDGPSANKPTLYIPSSLESSQNQDKFGHSQNKTVSPSESGISSSEEPFDESSSVDQEYVRIPLISMSSTEHTGSFETPSTISIITTTTKDAYPSKINIGPIGGFKKPDYRPSISYRPIYEPIKKFSTVNLPTYRPVYESTTKPRPVYDLIPRPSTQKISSTTYQYPVYQPSTKPSTASTGRPSSSFRPDYEAVESKPSFPSPEAIQSIYEILTKPNEGMLVTRYPIDGYSTGKASSPMMQFVTQKPSTQSELLKVTKYPSSAYTTGKSTTLNKLSTKIVSEQPVTPSVQTTTTKSQLKNSTSPIITSQKIEKKPEKLPPVSQIKEKIDVTEAPAQKDSTTGSNTIKSSEKITTNSKINEPTTVSSKIESTTAPVSVEKSTTLLTKQPIENKNFTTSSQPSISSEESSTNINDYHTFILQEDTTLLTQTESASIKPSESNIEFKSATKDGSLKTSTEKTTQKPLQITTQRIPVNEPTTENNLNLENTKKVGNEPSTAVKEESSIDEKEITFAPYEDKTDSTLEYTTSFAFVDNDDSKKPSSDSKSPTASEKVAIPTNELSNKTESDEKIVKEPIKEIKNTTTASTDKEQAVTEKNKNDQTFSNIKIIPYSSQLADLIKDQNKSDLPSYENKILELMGNYQSKLTPGSEEKLGVNAQSASENNAQEFNSSNDQVTISYEKMETATENIPTADEKVKISQPEIEISTVKVIPIYDDDSSMYTLPYDSSDKSTTPAENKIENSSSTVKSPGAMSPDSQISRKTTESVKLTSQEESFTTPIVTSTSTYTTLSDSIGDLSLPGLQETFNNYMKEHYDPNLFTTENYDEISGLPTFPPVLYKGISMNKNKVTTEDSPFEDYTVTDSPKYEMNEQKLGEDLTITENLDISKMDYTTLNPSIKGVDEVSTEIPELKETIAPPKSEVNNTIRLETPIIYLDLTSPDPTKKSSINEQISNSSLTRIKVKNPVLDIDKIITDAQTQSMIGSTESYVSSTDEPKPVTDIYSSTVLEDIGKTDAPIQSSDSDSLKETSEKVQEDSLNEKLTTILPQIEEKTTVRPFNIEDEETSTYGYHTSAIPNTEVKTQLPLELNPMENKSETSSQTEEKYDQSFNPPLEKISDLINQLQNSPSKHDPIGYDFSNGIATTIVPLEKFGLIMNESKPSSNDQLLTTLIDSITKTPFESKNSTFIVLQTLPTTIPYESTTTASIQSSTTEKQTKIEPSTFKNEATSVLSVVKQSVTGKPFVTTTYSTTKGSLDKIQSTIDKSAGRINLEDEKTKMPAVKPTEPSKFTMKNKGHFTTNKRPANDGYQSYNRKVTRPAIKATATSKITTSSSKATIASSSSTTTTTTTTAPAVMTTPKVVEEVKYSTEKSVSVHQKIVQEPAVSNLSASSKEGDQILSPQVVPEPELKKSPTSSKDGVQHLNPQIVSLDHSSGAIGLDQSNSGLDKDVAEFLNMCNELSFKFWTLANSGLSTSRSVTLSPFGMISTLAMIFLGARGLTSNQMNDILKLDDVVTFNPHLVFQNITDTVTLARGQGIENAAFVRALFADRLKVRRIIPFYKEQAQQFYEGAVVDINFSTAGDILKRRTNLLIRKQTGGRIKDFMKTQTVPLRSPLTALSANVFQTSCDSPDASSEGRDGEMYFAVSQTVKQRKLVPIPAVVWKSGVSAGYEPSLDATAVALGDPKRPVSFIMIMPGQQGLTAPGDNLERLETRLFGNPSDNPLDKLLKVIIPRRVEVQMPKFSHRSVVNITSALKKMGFDQLFTRNADLKGINGAGHDLYLADMLQVRWFLRKFKFHRTFLIDNKLIIKLKFFT